MPNENIIYFGDTAHLPYGEKSVAAIQAYTVKICDILLAKKCKLILIACNSASAAAFELAKEYTASRAKVVNVIDPVVDWVSEKYANQNVGVIGTRATINSEVYDQKMEQQQKNIKLKTLATPLLAAAIEEGFFNDSVSKALINSYLSHSNLKNIEALILGCTHYPLIKKDIESYYKSTSLEVIDTSDIVAQHIFDYLNNKELLNTDKKPFMKFFVSDFTKSFEVATQIFFKQKVHLEPYKLWE